MTKYCDYQINQLLQCHSHVPHLSNSELKHKKCNKWNVYDELQLWSCKCCKQLRASPEGLFEYWCFPVDLMKCSWRNKRLWVHSKHCWRPWDWNAGSFRARQKGKVKIIYYMRTIEAEKNQFYFICGSRLCCSNPCTWMHAFTAVFLT